MRIYLHSVWGISSVGRALAWHARGHRFESGILHAFFRKVSSSWNLFLLLKCILYLHVFRFLHQSFFISAGETLTVTNLAVHFQLIVFLSSICNEKDE